MFEKQKRAIKIWDKRYSSPEESKKASIEWQENNAVIFEKKYRYCARTYETIEDLKNTFLCFYGSHPEKCKERRTCPNFIPLEIEIQPELFD